MQNTIVEDKLALVDRALRSLLCDTPQFRDRRHRQLREDLTSAGQLQLVESVRNGIVDDSHLVRLIRLAMSRLLDRELNLVRVPQRTRRHARQNGKELPPVWCGFLKHEPPDKYDRVRELFADILDCCQNETEEAVVRLRANEVTRKQIAERLSIDPRQVTKILRAVEQRFDGVPERCRCGGRPETRFTSEPRCEDCFAADQQKNHGRSQGARLVA